MSVACYEHIFSFKIFNEIKDNGTILEAQDEEISLIQCFILNE